jgi:hypothetical protein
MRRLALLLVVACSSSAFALPPIPGYVKESLGDKAEYKAFMETFAGLKMKCDVCHKPGADKKAKGHGLNDFGEAMHKSLDDKAFMAAHKDKNAAEALRLFNEGWAKALEAKNAQGTSYGELIKAGKLPGSSE